MRRRILVLSVAVVAVVASACSSGGHHSAAGTTTSTTASAGPNPDVIPSVITPAYVDAVFRVLEHIDGNASRSLIAAKAVTPQVLADIRAIYNDPLYAEEVQIAHQSLQGDLTNVKKPPGDVVITVTSLISSSGRCVFVRTASDYSAVLLNPGPAVGAEYWALRRKTAGDDPGNINPTPWALAFNVDYSSGPTIVSNPCAG